MRNGTVKGVKKIKYDMGEERQKEAGDAKEGRTPDLGV